MKIKIFGFGFARPEGTAGKASGGMEFPMVLEQEG